MGIKTELQEELRHLGGPREGVEAQRQRVGARVPIAKTLISGEEPGELATRQAQRSRDLVAAHQQLRAAEAARPSPPPHLEGDKPARAVRAFRDAGLSAAQYDRAIDLYTTRGGRPQDVINAVGGARMSVEAAREIDDALGTEPRAYFRALDLHAEGQPVINAILNANGEAARRARSWREMTLEEGRRTADLLQHDPRRRTFPQTPSQRAQNRRDNKVAIIGIGVMGAALAGLAWLVFGRKPEPPPPPPQPPQPVKPPARSPQPPPARPAKSRGVTRP